MNPTTGRSAAVYLACGRPLPQRLLNFGLSAEALSPRRLD